MDSVKIREYIIILATEILGEKIFVSGSFPDEDVVPPFVVVSKQAVSEITTKSNGLISVDQFTGGKKWLESGLFHSRISVYTENDEQGQDLSYKLKLGFETFVSERRVHGCPVFRFAKDPSVSVSVYKGKSKLWMTDLIASFYYEAIYEEKNIDTL